MEGLQAMSRLITPGVDIAVLLSDGTPSEQLIDNDPRPIEECLRQLRKPSVLLHTLGFGNFNTHVLQRLAEIGGGEFHSNQLDVGALRQTFRHLSVSVSTLRSSVLTHGETALAPLPPREMEPEDAWESQEKSLSEVTSAWIMLPGKETGSLEAQGDARKVWLHKKPFAAGALRYAMHFFISREQQNKRDERGLHLVVKESKFVSACSTPQQVHVAFLANHRRAEGLARAFNECVEGRLGEERSKLFKVQFTPAFIIQLRDVATESGYRYVTAEKYIPGVYMKFNGNDGYVNTSKDTKDIANVVAAFSHFTFDQTEGAELCVDIQGVGIMWTDPQLHSTDKTFGPADLGLDGMRRFFRSHRCTDLCRELGLRHVDSESLAFGGAQTLEVDVVENRKCLICFVGERVMICRPCGHLCYCPSCVPTPRRHGEKCPVCRQGVANFTESTSEELTTYLRDSVLQKDKH